MNDVVYTVDQTDRIQSVNDAWSAFAFANEGREALPSSVIGHSLWDFMSDPTTIHVYRQLFENVRASREFARLSIRCDSPARRRLCELTISSLPEDGLEFRICTIHEDRRESIPLLEVQGERSLAFLRICSFCKRVPERSGRWMEVEEAIATVEALRKKPPPKLVPCVCEDCEYRMGEVIEEAELAGTTTIMRGKKR